MKLDGWTPKPGDWVYAWRTRPEGRPPVVARVVRPNILVGASRNAWVLDRPWPDMLEAGAAGCVPERCRPATPDEIAAACMTCPTGPQDSP